MGKTVQEVYPAWWSNWGVSGAETAVAVLRQQYTRSYRPRLPTYLLWPSATPAADDQALQRAINSCTGGCTVLQSRTLFLRDAVRLSTRAGHFCTAHAGIMAASKSAGGSCLMADVVHAEEPDQGALSVLCPSAHRSACPSAAAASVAGKPSRLLDPAAKPSPIACRRQGHHCASRAVLQAGGPDKRAQLPAVRDYGVGEPAAAGKVWNPRHRWNALPAAPQPQMRWWRALCQPVCSRSLPPACT